MHLISKRLLTLALCIIAVIATHAQADGVALRMETQQAEVGEFVRVVIDIEGENGFESITEPKIDGLVLRRLPGQQSQTSISVVNNQRTRRVTSSVTYEVIATRAGSFTIAPFSIMIAGRAYGTQPMLLSVKAANDAPVLEVRVIGVPASVYVGQKCAIRLEIFLKPFKAREFNYVMNEQDAWNVVQSDLEQSELGPFKQELLRLRRESQRPSGERIIVAGEEYWKFRVEREYDPIQVGTPDFGPIRIDLHYPATLSKRRDVFGLGNSLQVESHRFVSATAATPDITVLEVPTIDQPKGYSGAVGSFSIRATVSPTSAAVGDPMTLSIEIVDREQNAELGTLQAPDLSVDPAFTGSFKIPAERAAGRVDGSRKVFTQTLRPLHDRIQEIPAISFSTFDPTSQRFETVSTDPIPIQVHASERVYLSDDSSVSNAGAPQPKSRVGGLVTNMTREEAPEFGQTFSLSSLSLGAFAVPPLAAGILFLARRRKLASARDPMRKRRTQAMHRAVERVRTATRADERQHALLDFIADRAGLPQGALTRADACRVLATAGASSALVEAFDEATSAAERATYGSAALDRDPDGARALTALSAIADAKLDWEGANR